MIKRIFAAMALALVTAGVGHAAEFGQLRTQDPRFLPDYHQLHDVLSPDSNPKAGPFDQEASTDALPTVYQLLPVE